MKREEAEHAKSRTLNRQANYYTSTIGEAQRWKTFFRITA